ncbi:mitochondrial succinate-fumarate transporter 1 [Euphorbia lathyris]|uniref:mitochondrial succinate-fumarate transporter 1 n=1 Tax=Euphorbia lathyris TaxID=212925 RepID=UPI00331383F4
MKDSTEENASPIVKKGAAVPPYMKAVSGSLGGIVEACCLQPIDVIKTRLQLDRVGTYKGIIHCGKTVSQTEGVRALWKGLTPFATHLTLKYSLRMGSNAVFQGPFKDSETGHISNRGRLMAGFGAGVLEALAIVTPFEVVKIRLQQQKGLSPELFKYKGPIHCARIIVREEGLFGLWAGAAPTVMRNGTNQAAMFTAKNAFDVVLWKKHEGDGKALQPWQSMISGFLAGTAGPMCTGPFDVVKTRLMAQTREGGGGLKYKGMIHAIRTIYAEEGLRALWKGLLPRLMRIPPGQAIMWAVADQITGLYEKRYMHNAPL